MKRKNVPDKEDEIGLITDELMRRKRNTSRANETRHQPPTSIDPPEALSSSPPPEVRTPEQHIPEPQSSEALSISPPPPEMRTPEPHTPEPRAPEEALRLFKLSSSPVRVSGSYVGVNAKFAAAGNANLCRVDKSLFCIGFWDQVSESGRICLPRRSGKTYNLIQLLLFCSMAPEESHLDVPDSAIEELGQSAEQIRQMDVATKCQLKRTLLFEDSLLKEKHRVFFDEHFMKHPVIHISFSLCKGTPVGRFYVRLCDAIATAANNWLKQYPLIEGVEVENTNIYLQTLQKTLAVYKDARYATKNFASEYADMPMQLFIGLSEFVGECIGKYILLIDEYDVPFIHAHLKSWSDEEKEEAQNSLKGLIQAMFKDNRYLRKGLLVGVFEVPLTELGSGANNIVDFPMVPFKHVTGNGSIVSATYKHSGRGLDALTDSFWFNTKEVEGLLETSATRFPQIAEHRDEVMAVIKDWYNGYYFGRFRGKYNPWSVCAFIECLCSQLVSSEYGELRNVPDAIKPAARAHWVATGTTDLIEQQFTNHRHQAIRLMESLIREYRETRLGGLDHDLALSNSQAVSLQLPKPNMNIVNSGKYSTEGMLTLCLFAGYLTHKHPDSVCIPNHEVYNVWCTLFTRTLLGTGFVERAEVNARGSLLVELWEGKTAILSSFIKEAFGTLTNHAKYKEKHYANIVATVLTAASCLGALSHPDQASSHTSHAVTTRENHTGDGHCDHLMRLYSTDNKPNQFGVLIEFKLIPREKRDNIRHHEALAKKALGQIIENRYPACLSRCTERVDIGIAIGSNVVHILTQLHKLDVATKKWKPVELLINSAN